jgi:hypothetical protein
MTHTVFEMLWIRSLLHDLGIDAPTPMHMFSDNQLVIFVANNLVLHECIQHIKSLYSRFVDASTDCHSLCSLK